MDEKWTRARDEGLLGKIAAGPAPQLGQEQVEQLPALLSQGAGAHGFRGAMWTAQRVAAVIMKQSGVSYHPAHVSRLLNMQMQECSYRGEPVVAFLQMLLRKIPGKLLVIWDGSPIHRVQVVKDFLAKGTAKQTLCR